MTKAELKKATDNEVIFEMIQVYADWCYRSFLGSGFNAVRKHLDSIEAEILKRGILTQKQIDHLNV